MPRLQQELGELQATAARHESEAAFHQVTPAQWHPCCVPGTFTAPSSRLQAQLARVQTQLASERQGAQQQGTTAEAARLQEALRERERELAAAKAQLAARAAERPPAPPAAAAGASSCEGAEECESRDLEVAQMQLMLLQAKIRCAELEGEKEDQRGRARRLAKELSSMGGDAMQASGARCLLTCGH